MKSRLNFGPRALRSILLRNHGNLDPVPEGYSAIGLRDGALVIKDSDDNETPVVASNPTGVTGADPVTNMMSLSQAEYDAITPVAGTLYVIV